MGWANTHLHEFAIAGGRYGIVDPQLLEDKRFRLKDVLGGEIQGFTYTYDFGDNWVHRISVEQLVPADENTNTWPICLAGANACPPEDVGGTLGYGDFLHAMRDPAHEKHQAMWRWWGGPFDPSGFDVNAANIALRRLR